MSRSRYPRVAPITRRPAPRVPKLPKLLLAYYRDGEFSHIQRIPDPRAGVIHAINRDWSKYGLAAVPIDTAADVKPAGQRRKAGAK